MTDSERPAKQASWEKLRAGLPVTAGLLVALAGSAGFLVVPLVVAALRHNGVPELWTGLIGSADPAGMFIGAALALFRFVRAAPRKWALIAVTVALLANAGSLTLDAAALLLVLRLLSGTAGGIAMALGLAALSHARFPDRSFALLTLTQMLFGALVASLGEGGAGGLGIIYRCMFALQLVGLVAAALLARTAVLPDAPVSGVPPRRLRPTLFGYTAAANFCAAAGFMLLWVSIPGAARAAGLPADATVLVFDVGLAGGCIGALITMIIGGQTRRGVIVAGLFALGLTGMAIIGLTDNMPLFLIGTFLLQFSTAAAFYGFGAVSEADGTGRLPIVHMLAVKAGFGLAPMAASLVLGSAGMATVIAFAFIVNGVAALLYQMLVRTAAAEAAQG
ncbi:hypothetical protein ACMT1E_09560 [Sphingomonas flavalba]|uniref:hypothetical protein n=1 Tax=Sphingomonas flavalba TaxID=2559804 RepID=UPI0039E127BD